MTMYSNNGWGSHAPGTIDPPATSDEYELRNSGKPAKAIIGMAILVVFALALAFFKPSADNMAQSPTIQQKTGSAITQMNRDPGQTTGAAPSTRVN
jgi:hypothetical protein